MAKILLAASRELCPALGRVLAGHELVCPETLEQVEQHLRAERFDLIVSTVLFDESRMFDLLRMAKSTHEWQRIPFVAVRVRKKVIDSKIALEAVAFTCHALGAAAFFDYPNYKVDPDRELRQDIERFLPS